MRLFLGVTCLAVGMACSSSTPVPIAPSPLQSPASFFETLVVCGNDPVSIPSGQPCAAEGEIVPRGAGEFLVFLGIDYQFRLYAEHSARSNRCRIFGNIQADRDLATAVATFNTNEVLVFRQPSPLYLTGLRFKPAKIGNYFFHVQATDSCDVPPGVINPPQPVAVTVK